MGWAKCPQAFWDVEGGVIIEDQSTRPRGFEGALYIVYHVLLNYSCMLACLMLITWSPNELQ